MVAQPIVSPIPAPPPTAAPEADAVAADTDRFPEFPPRDDMQNTIFINLPGYLGALNLHFGFSNAAIVVSEFPLGWDRSQRLGLLIPDLMVAFNVDAGAILSDGGYAIDYQGKPPDFVLEVAPRIPSARDEFIKKMGYAAYAIPEYWRFDNNDGGDYTTGLSGGRLVDGQYLPIEILEIDQARYRGYSAVLGLYLCWEYGYLRWYDPQTGYLLTHYEETTRRRTAEAERRAIEAERDAERIAEGAARLDEAAAQHAAEAARRAAEAERDAERAERLRLEAEIRRLRNA